MASPQLNLSSSIWLYTNPKPQCGSTGWVLFSWSLFESAILVSLDLGCTSELPGKFLLKNKQKQCLDLPTLPLQDSELIGQIYTKWLQSAVKAENH